MPIAPDEQTRRRQRRRRLLPVLLALASLGIVAAVARRKPPPAPVTVRGQAATAAAVPAVAPTVSVVGTPLEAGRQRGVALGAPMRKVADDLLYDHLGPAAATPAAARGIARRLAKHIPQQYIDELSATAESGGIWYDDLLASQCLADLADVGCGLAAAVMQPAARGDDLLLQYTLENPDSAAAGCLVVTSCDTEGALPWVGVALAGSLGPLVGFNRDGLALALLTLTPPKSIADGVPALVLCRRVLDECQTIDEAVALIDSLPRAAPFLLLLAESSPTPTATVLEVGLEQTARRPAEAGRIVATNHLRALHEPPLQPEESGVCERYDKVRAWLAGQAGTVDEHSLPLRETGTYTTANVLWAALQPRGKRLTVACGDPPAALREGDRFRWDIEAGSVSGDTGASP